MPRIFGTSNRDLLEGSPLNDILRGVQGNDTLIGDDGDDTIYGGRGHDRLSGDAGHDELIGGYGRDVMSGGDGDDTLVGLDQDTVDGGSGNDTAVYTSHGSLAHVADYHGGNGTDTIVLDLTQAQFWGNAAIYADVQALHDHIDAGGQGTFTLSSLNLQVTGFEQLVLTVDGMTTDPYIGAYAPVYDHAAEDDAAFEEVDRKFAAFPDGYAGMSVSDHAVIATFDARIGQSVTFDLADVDTVFDDPDGHGMTWQVAGFFDINGQELDPAGTPTRVGFDTGQTTPFHDGRFTFNFDNSDYGHILIGLEARDQTGRSSDEMAFVLVNAYRFVDGNENSNALFGGDYDDSIRGGRGADVLYGFEGDDTLRGGKGNDQLRAHDGNDVLYGDGGHDLLYGFGGNDTIYGGDKNDLIEGSGGTDLLFGDNGADTINGGGGNDTLYGGSGSDRIEGSGHNDLMFGGGDADVFLFGTTDGHDTIGDFAYGADRIDLRGAAIGSLTQIDQNNDSTPDGWLLTYATGTILFEGLTASNVEASVLLV